MLIITHLLSVPHNELVAEIGIAVSAQVRTGVVRSNVFADDTATCLALSFILL